MKCLHKPRSLKLKFYFIGVNYSAYTLLDHCQGFSPILLPFVSSLA